MSLVAIKNYFVSKKFGNILLITKDYKILFIQNI